MAHRNSLAMLVLGAMLLVPACATQPATVTPAGLSLSIPPLPSETPTRTPSPLPTSTPSPLPPTATASPRPPTATATRVPPSPTPTHVPATPTPVPPTPTITPTPDPIYARWDRVSGTITWLDVPLPGIPVALYTADRYWCGSKDSFQHTVTDSQGRYVFLDVPPGGYWIGVNGGGQMLNEGIVKPYSYDCYPQFTKVNTPENWPFQLSKTDVKVAFPARDAVLNTANPIFYWEAYPGAASYSILLDRQADRWVRIYNDARTKELSFPCATPLPSGFHYKLRVYAWDAQGRRMAYGDVMFAVQQ